MQDNTITLKGSQLDMNFNQVPTQTVYLLVQWPYLDQLMHYDWFNAECLPYQPSGEAPSPLAALVPLERYSETLKQGINALRI
ncbi:hypothetical protein [Mucilaginibacter sp.]